MHVRKSIGALALLLAAAGCADIQEARRAQRPDSAGPGERTPSSVEVGLAAGSELTLERGIEIALTYNPQVAIARRRAEAARARLRAAEAGYLPQVSTGGSAVKSDTSKTRQARNSLSADVSAGLVFFDFGRTAAVSRQAAEEFLAAQQDLLTAETEVAFGLRQAFYNVLRQQEIIRVAEETVRQFEKRLEQVRGFVEVGTRVKYDQTKAEVDLGNARLSLIKAKAALAADEAVLNNALGLAEAEAYAVEKPAESPEWAMSPAGAAAAARARHPRLLAQTTRVRAASSAVDAAVAELFPQLSLRGAFSVAGTLTPLTWSWSVGPLADWVLFAGGARTARVRESVAGLMEARAGRAQIEQQIVLDIRQGYAALDAARERATVSQLIVQQAEENLTLVQGRYAVGRASSVELTDAQVALANARGERIQAEYDERTAVAQIQRAIGRGR